MEQNPTDETPKFWQNQTKKSRLSSFLNATFLFALLLTIALVTIFFIISYSHSTVSKPNTSSRLKKNWNSLNLILVSFAILCGLLGRKNIKQNNEDHDRATSAVYVAHRKSDEWVDRKRSGLRGSSSYPEFRSPEDFGVSAEEKWRLFDDSDVYRYRPLKTSISDDGRISRKRDDAVRISRTRGPAKYGEPVGMRTVHVDTFITAGKNREPPEATKSGLHAMHERTEEVPVVEVAKLRRRRSHSLDDFNKILPNDTQPPPPTLIHAASAPPQEPPPTVEEPVYVQPRVMEEVERRPIRRSQSLDNFEELLRSRSPGEREGKSSRNGKRRGGAAKEFASTIASLYNQTKKKRRRQRSKESFDDINVHSHSSISPSLTRPAPPPVPPPPPPPPHTSVFHNFFKKGSKSKRFNSPSSLTPVSPPPPPPLPPPLLSNRKSQHIVSPSKQSPPPPPPPPPSSSSLRKSRHNVTPTESSLKPPLIKSPPHRLRTRVVPPLDHMRPPPESSSRPSVPTTHRRSHRNKVSPPPEQIPPLPPSSKRKSYQTVLPPPPPPESPSPVKTLTSESIRSRRPNTPGRPPLPTHFTGDSDFLNSGNQSPLIPMPPAPPPPPFKMTPFHFKVRDGFVNIRSNSTSRASSPDLDAADISSRESTPVKMDDGDGATSVFCPSPDVDTKADSFIKRFRAGLKLEKVNSWKAKQEMGFQGPSPGPSPRMRNLG